MLLLLLSGCSRSLYPSPEIVTDAGNGTFWVSGSDGYAAFFDGAQLLRADYPTIEGWFFNKPSSGVIRAEGDVFLWTQAGYIYRWTGTDWAQAFHFPFLLDADTPPAIMRYFRGPQGDVFFLIEGYKLARATSMTALFNNAFDFVPPMPYAQWMGFVHNRLHALGYDKAGGNLALHQFDEPSATWNIVHRIPPISDVIAVVELPSTAQLAVVYRGGFITFDSDGTPQFHYISELSYERPPSATSASQPTYIRSVMRVGTSLWMNADSSNYGRPALIEFRTQGRPRLLSCEMSVGWVVGAVSVDSTRIHLMTSNAAVIELDTTRGCTTLVDSVSIY